MPLRKNNTRTFHRTLYAGELETITLLKRNDDMHAGTITSYIIYQCRRGQATRSGEPIQGEMLSDYRLTWHIPAFELERVGIDHLNPLDVIIDYKNRYYQPESTTTIHLKLWENHMCVDCLRIDPPTVAS